MSKRTDRADRLVLGVMGAVMTAVSAGALAYVAASLYGGLYDGRSRYALEPSFVMAADEPALFYVTLICLAVLSGYAGWIGVRMARQALRGPAGK